MSKCDLAIEFDRPDRQFLTGEAVTGTAYVRVNKDVKCNGFLIEGLYRTHGRGNRATLTYHTETLTSGQWRAGEQYKFPFSIPAPDHPLTYRGNYLNIDHYVKLRVDIPWAFDPKLEEEFLLAPAKNCQYEQMLADLPEPGKSSSVLRMVLTVIGLAAFAFGVVMLFATWFGMIPLLIGTLLIVLNLRRMLAERSLGPVEFVDFNRQLAPGSNATGEIMFTPKSNGQVNSISVELKGSEVCVSGSGSNRTTHTHKLFNERQVLANAFQLQSGMLVRIPVDFRIPPTSAYTVKLGDNQIIWQAVFHIDIARWPDWVHTEPLQVVPDPSGATSVAPGPTNQLPDALSVSLDGTSTGAAPIPIPIPAEQSAPEPASAEQQIPTPGLRTDLPNIVRQLQESDRFNDDAKQLVNSLATELFLIEVVVDRINPTHGYFDDARYEDGQTVVGTVKETDTNVSVQLPKDYNEQLESVEHGQVWTGQGVLIKWDGLYERLEMMGF